MSNKRIAVIRNVAEKLHKFEDDLDTALVSASELTIATANGRKDADLSAITGSEAMAQIGEAMKMIHEARQQIVEAHGNLADLTGQMGLPAYASGGGWKIEPSASDKPKIKVVSDKQQEVA